MRGAFVEDPRGERFPPVELRAARDGPDPGGERNEEGAKSPDESDRHGEERREQMAGSEQRGGAGEGCDGVDAIGGAKQCGAVHELLLKWKFAAEDARGGEVDRFPHR